MFATDPQVVAVRAESKFKTFKELVEPGKRDPGTIPVGITRATGTPRLAIAQLLSENFWNVWQSAGALPRLTAKVQVTSLT